MTRKSLAEQVRQFWDAWERDGLDGLLARVPDDVEWLPLASEGRVLRGSADLRAFWSQQEAKGNREQAVAFRFEEEGECVIVAGSLRHFAPHGWADSQPMWVFFFRGEQLRRAVGYRTRQEALAAAAAHNAVG